MFIKKLIFPKDMESTKNPMFNNLPSLDFCYEEEIPKSNDNKTTDPLKKIAKFVILIGKNGSGKTSLLILIKKLIKLYVNVKKNTPPLEEHDDNYFTINLSLIDREINFLFQKPSGDLYITLENMDIFNPEKELLCKVFCDNNNNNNDILIDCTFFPTSSSIDKNENEDYCSEMYEADIKCKNINVLERYNQLFSKFEIKTFGNSIEKDIRFNINKKFNRSINQLPSGFRQLFNLWSAMFIVNDTIFLIDEPENSLYPLEQEKISSFFIREFEKNIKTQFFIATHSPFILKNFLNRDDAVIINVENGENILKSEKKKLLLNADNNISYDEISYLYYDIVTSGYYISLYETMKQKFKCFIKKIESFDLSSYKNQIVIKCLKNGGFTYLSHCLKDAINALNSNNNKNKWKLKYSIDEFLLEIGFGTRETLEIYIVAQVCNWAQMQNENRTCMNEHEELSISTNLTRLRHVIAHDSNLGEINHRIYEDKSNVSKFKKFCQNINKENKKDKTEYFYDKYKKNPNELLKSQIETIRVILIDWERIIDKVFAYFLQRK